MADNDNDIMSRKPNTLDRIGSEEPSSRSFRSDLSLMDRRGSIPTVEMQKIQKLISDLEAEYKKKASETLTLARSTHAGDKDYLVKYLTSIGMKPKVATAQVEANIGDALRIGRLLDRQVRVYEAEYRKNKSALEEELQQKREARMSVSAREFEQHIISRVAHPRVGISSMRQDPEFQKEVQKYAEIAHPGSLAKGIARSSMARDIAGVAFAVAGADVRTQEGRERFLSAEQRYEETRRKSLILEEAQKEQEKKRSESERLIDRGQKIAGRIRERRGLEEIQADVRTGKYSDRKEQLQKLKATEDAYNAALEQATREHKTLTGITAKTAKSLAEAENAYDKQNKILKEMAGGGGRSGRIDRIASYGDLLGRGVDLAGYLTVGLQSEQMAMRIGMANAMNRRQSDVFAATQGDMSALRRLTENQFEQAVQFSGAYKTRANIAGGVGALIDVSTGAIGAAATAQGLFPWSLTGGSIASNMISGVRGGARVLAGVTGAETQLDFFSKFNQLKDIVNDIPDAAKQAFFDYRLGALQSMRGAGQRTSAMYDEATSVATMYQMAGLGISPTETSRLFGVGINAIGASFVRDPATARRMVARGAELQAGGYMSAEDYLQRVGQAAALGGGQKDIEEILARAVARGVDDARSLNNLFGIVGSLAREGAGRGVPTMGITRGAVTDLLERYRDLPIDEVLKQNLAGSQLQNLTQLTSGVNVDIPNMVYLSGIEKRFPGIGPVRKGELAGVSLLELASMPELVKGLVPGQEVPVSTQAALGKSIGAFVDPSGKFRGMGSFYDELIAKAQKPQTARLSGRDVAIAEEYLRTGNEDVLKSLSKTGHEAIDLPSLYAARAVVSPKYQLPVAPLPGLTGAAAATQDILGIGARGKAKQIFAGQSFYEQLAEQANLAAGGAPTQVPFASAANPMSYIATMMGTQLEEFSPEKAGKEAAQAAEKMTLDSSEFDKSVTSFSKAVDKLVKAVEPLGVNLSSGIDYTYSNMGPLADPDAYGAYVSTFNRSKSFLLGH